MACEARQIKDREHRRQMLFAVPEIVLEVVSLGFQDIERLVLYFPSGPAAGGEFGDISRLTSSSVMKLLR
jgi:hypothetical protein